MNSDFSTVLNCMDQEVNAKTYNFKNSLFQIAVQRLHQPDLEILMESQNMSPLQLKKMKKTVLSRNNAKFHHIFYLNIAPYIEESKGFQTPKYHCYVISFNRFTVSCTMSEKISHNSSNMSKLLMFSL